MAERNGAQKMGQVTPEQIQGILINPFYAILGTEHFDIRPLLLATSVEFVRLDQYTVYPYAFHLIDLCVDNVLRFGNGEANNA